MKNSEAEERIDGFRNRDHRRCKFQFPEDVEYLISRVDELEKENEDLKTQVRRLYLYGKK